MAYSGIKLSREDWQIFNSELNKPNEAELSGIDLFWNSFEIETKDCEINSTLIVEVEEAKAKEIENALKEIANRDLLRNIEVKF